MEKGVFSQKHIEFLREQYGRIKKIDPDVFTKGLDKVFQGMTTDQVVQLARAEIKFLSTAAYFEAKKRGCVIEGWKVQS